MIKRTTPIAPKTVIEYNEVVAQVTMMGGSWKRYHRQFDANLSFADADVQFKEWADNIDLAHDDVLPFLSDGLHNGGDLLAGAAPGGP